MVLAASVYDRFIWWYSKGGILEASYIFMGCLWAELLAGFLLATCCVGCFGQHGHYGPNWTRKMEHLWFLKPRLIFLLDHMATAQHHWPSKIYPLVNFHITMEHHHFQRGINYFYGHFNSYVKCPEGKLPPFSHSFPTIFPWTHEVSHGFLMFLHVDPSSKWWTSDHPKACYRRWSWCAGL